jgi:GNAT superfamily N-acetyltransferase
MIRAVDRGDLTFVREECERHWGGPQIWSLGRMFRADELPGFVAMLDGQRAGLVTYSVTPGGYQCEIVTLSARVERRGVGRLLLETAVEAARGAGCARVYLTTTNDNITALGFYQKRGWRLAALHKGLVDAARARAPSIPTVAPNGIPIRDEIELELWLQLPLPPEPRT